MMTSTTSQQMFCFLCVCVYRLQCRGSSWSRLAPSCSAPAYQPQEGEPGLRFRRRSGFTATVVISAVHKQRLPSNINCIYCVWHTTLLQTSFCSMMTSTSKPPIFLERRFGEEDHRRRRRLQMESSLTAGTLGAFRGRCLSQNHKAVECLNSSEHTVNFNCGPTLWSRVKKTKQQKNYLNLNY